MIVLLLKRNFNEKESDLICYPSTLKSTIKQKIKHGDTTAHSIRRFTTRKKTLGNASHTFVCYLVQRRTFFLTTEKNLESGTTEIRIQPLSIENELLCLKLLSDRANDKLCAFSTTLQEDKKELAWTKKLLAGTEGVFKDLERKRMHLLLSIGEKKVLKFYKTLLAKAKSLVSLGWAEFLVRTKNFVRDKKNPFKVYVTNVLFELMKRKHNMDDYNFVDDDNSVIVIN